MDDPLLVRRFECLGNLLRNRQRFVDRDRAFRDPLREVVTLDQFHHQRGDATAFFEAVDVGDVRVIQRGERFGFAGEPRKALRIMRERLGQHLDRHVAIELRVARAPHLPHPAFAERSGDLVGAETGAGSKCHVVCVDRVGQPAKRPGGARPSQIFRARSWLISLWRGIVDAFFTVLLTYTVWLPPSRRNSHPCCSRCRRRSRRFTS